MSDSDNQNRNLPDDASLGETSDDVTRSVWRLAGRSDSMPERIGRYRVLSKLGEGGFGVVYLVEQTEPVKRQVALKVIKPGMDSDAVIARFEQESQALAVMDHPNVARVIDAGMTERHLPYFVMEFVNGETITAYCDRHMLTLRDRLELFISVCEAVQHAHMKGIVHRDIKPSNVLVMNGDAGPTVKVIDFGVAKALSHTLTQATIFTEQGQLIGTPEYMSPEQAEVGGTDIDTRTDVYSLGVLLYELLTGATPFDRKTLRGGGFAEIQRMIREVDPPKPSTRFSSMGEEAAAIALHRQSRRDDLLRELSRELDWIPLKAMRKERASRYRTPSDLADDIRNYLEGRPLNAGPESAAYRFRKFVRRHRGPVTATGAVMLVLVCGITVTTFAMYEARTAKRAEAAQRQIAEHRAREALETAERALAAEADAQQRAEELEQVAAFQEQQLTEIDPAVMGLHLRQNIIEKRRAMLHAGGVDDDAISAAIGVLESSLIGVNFTDVALEALDENIFERAIASIDEQFSDQPRVKARLLQALASVMVDCGLLDRAETMQEEALTIRREVLGDEHRDTLTSVNNMGVLLRIIGRHEEAHQLQTEALEGRRRMLGNDDPDTMTSINDMGELLQHMQRFEDSEAHFVEALELRRQVLGDEHRDTLLSIFNLGSVLHLQGRHSEAETFLLEAFDGFRQTRGDADPYALAAKHNLAMVMQHQGRMADSIEYMQSIQGQLGEALGELHPHTLMVLSNLAVALHYQRDHDEAVRYARQVLDGRRRLFSNNHPDVRNAIHNMAYILGFAGKARFADGRHEEAIAAFRETVDLLQQILSADDNELIVMKNNLGFALVTRGQSLAELEHFAEAESLLIDAHVIWKVTRGADHSETRNLIDLIGSMYDRWHERVPDGGHDARAAQWRAKLEGLNRELEAAAEVDDADQ